jgi:predicted ribosome quality control (RQC) complex YloA/Tae2 family protein
MSKGRGYRSFAVGGYEVLVGKGSADNDVLTFHLANGSDVWLHVGGGTPGSHVVVRNPSGGDVPQAVVEGAAALAAYYSKARGAPLVKVDWCRRVDVFKPRGAPAGMVELKRHKTIKVKPGLPEAANDDDGAPKAKSR